MITPNMLNAVGRSVHNEHWERYLRILYTEFQNNFSPPWLHGLCKQSSWNEILPSSVRSSSVSFYARISFKFGVIHTRVTFLDFLKKVHFHLITPARVYNFVFVLLTWDPMGVKVSKHYSSYKSQSFHTVLNFPSNCQHKTTLGTFATLRFRFLRIIFSKISNSPLYHTEKPKTSIIWKISDRGAKRSEFGASMQYSNIYIGTFDLVPFKVIWGHTVHLLFFLLKKYAFQNTTSSTNCNPNVSHFSGIMFSMVPTKLRFLFLKFWKLKL